MPSSSGGVADDDLDTADDGVVYTTERPMIPIPAERNAFGGVIPSPGDLHPDPGHFCQQLTESLDHWRAEALRVVWLEIPIDKSSLIPVAVECGFCFHHSSEDYLMLALRLVPEAAVPAPASHYIGAGGVTLNARGELLVVSEQHHQRPGQLPRYKLPGGALHEGEHLTEAVVREVFEETGVRAQFEAMACFRHWHGYRYGKSDMYFICRLRALSEEISIQEEEIAESLWMPVEEYLSHERVSPFNKEIVLAAVNTPGLSRVESEGYGDPEQYEFFMPRPSNDAESKP